MDLKYLKTFNFIQSDNIYDILRPWFFLNKLHGIFPYNLNRNQIQLSILGFCYSIFTTIACLICFIVLFIQCNITKATKFDTLEALLQFNCYFIQGSFITVTTCFLSNSRLVFLKKLKEVSLMLTKKECLLVAAIIYFLGTVGYMFLMAQMYNAIKSLQKTFGMYITTVVFLMDVQYASYVLIIKACFKNINTNLKKLKQNKLNADGIKVCDNLKQQSYFKNLQVLKLRKLQQKYHEVSKVINVLNSVFTIQLISTVLMTFVEVTFGLYFFLLHSQGKKSIDLDKQVWINYYITSVTYYSLKLSIIVWICQEARNESLKTGVIVHDVILHRGCEQLETEVR